MATFQIIAQVSLREAGVGLQSPQATGNVNTVVLAPVMLGQSGANNTSNSTDLSNAMSTMTTAITAVANSTSTWATLLSGWQTGGSTA